MEEENSPLEELKRLYALKAEEYGLPDFDSLNRDFSVEKAADKETDFVLREVRTMMSEKAIAYMHFTETLINPSNGSPFFFRLIKYLDSDDRKILEETYSLLGMLSIEISELDCTYDEKAEAEFIKKLVIDWKIVAKNMKILIEKFKAKWNEKTVGSSDKGYFG